MKDQKGKRNNNLTEEEKEEVMMAEDEANNTFSNADEDSIDNIDNLDTNEEDQSEKSGMPRAVKTFAGLAGAAGNSLNEATKDVNTNSFGDDDEYEDKYANYNPYTSGIENTFTSTPNRVSDLIKQMKRNDLTKSEKEREEERLAQDQGVDNVNKDAKANNTSNQKGNSSLTQPEKKTQIQDNKTLAGAGADKEKAEKSKEALDNKFGKPEKKESLIDKLSKSKQKRKAEKEAAKKAVKEKGALNTAVEKVTGTSVKTIIGYVLKIILIIIAVILVLSLIVAVIFYFSNNYTREETNELDAKRLDTRVARAIYALKENEEITDTYQEYFSVSQGTVLANYKKNYDRLVPSTELEKIKTGEDPDQAFITQDTSSWYLLYLERLSYAWGGYLDWEPEYLDYGTNLCNCANRNPNTTLVETWRTIAEKVGQEYGIDANILLSVVDIESSGNPHAKNGTHWGLGQIGEDFTSYFEDGEEYKTWTKEQRVPEDEGTCDLNDNGHQQVATMQFTYIARRLTHQMAIFLKQVKNTSLSQASNLDKKIAISYVVTGYNQGEDRIKSLYEVYGDELFTDDGSNYYEKFLAHVNDRLPSGYLMIGSSQANYLKLFNKFYEVYSGATLSEATVNPTNWYKADEVEGNDIDGSVGVYPGAVTESVKLVAGSTEVNVINQIKEKYYNEKIEYIVNQYNRWMKKFDNFYLTNYSNKFIRDEDGNLIPELYAKDKYGQDTSEVIKHQSYIHNIVSTISTYKSAKIYSSSSRDEDYTKFQNDIDNEINQFNTAQKVETKTTESLSDVESLISINRYEMNFEVVTGVDTSANFYENDEAIDIIENSLSYSVPIYEYVSTNASNGYKSFFNYEIYNANNYNSDFTLKINDFTFRSKLEEVKRKNISLKSLLDNGWSQEAQTSAELSFEEAFACLYLDNNKAYNSSNHYVYVPSNLDDYYYVVNGKTYDKMVENIYAIEEYYTQDWEAYLGSEYELTNPELCDSVNKNFVYDHLTTEVTRDYYLSNLRPSKYTGLKYEATFDYINEESGSNQIKDADQVETYYKRDVYRKIYDEFGYDTYEREYVTTIYQKTITRNTKYTKEKSRNMTINTRGIN